LGKTTRNVNSLPAVWVSGLVTGMILVTGGNETNPRLQTEEKIAVINFRNSVGTVQGD
jgi:translation initiation factor 2 gamma subunit (eIF-2gamma)